MRKEYLEEELGENTYTVQFIKIAEVIDPLNQGEVRMQLSFSQSSFC